MSEGALTRKKSALRNLLPRRIHFLKYSGKIIENKRNRIALTIIYYFIIGRKVKYDARKDMEIFPFFN